MCCAHERIKMRVGMRWVKSEGKRTLERSRRRCEDNINMNLKGKG